MFLLQVTNLFPINWLINWVFSLFYYCLILTSSLRRLRLRENWDFGLYEMGLALQVFMIGIALVVHGSEGNYLIFTVFFSMFYTINPYGYCFQFHVGDDVSLFLSFSYFLVLGFLFVFGQQFEIWVNQIRSCQCGLCDTCLY